MSITIHYTASVAYPVRAFALSQRGWVRFGFAFLLLGLLAALLSVIVGPDDWWVHGAWCISGMVIAFSVLKRTIGRSFDLVLKDHLVMFTAAFTFYFLFGALFMVFGPEGEVAYSLNYYFVDASTGLGVDAVNGVGFGIALITSALSPRCWFTRATDRIARVASRVSIIKVMVVLMLLGTFSLLNTLMVDFGFREGIVSGAWRALSKFSLVAIFLGAAYSGRYARVLLIAAVFLTLLSSFSGMLLFNKTQIIIPLGVLVVGLVMRYQSSRVLISGLLILISVYILVGGAIPYGRNILVENNNVALETRWFLFSEGFKASLEGDELAQNSSWGRLSYVPSQGAAIDFYDAGNGGDDLHLIPWAFVPRIVAPNKPIISQSGADFHTKITGNVGSSTGQGIFVSGYYNMGWFGVIMAAIICGWLLAQTSAIANAIYSRRAMLLLPLALFGLYMAFRIDGHFVVDYIGAFVFILYTILLMTFLLAVSKPKFVNN